MKNRKRLWLVFVMVSVAVFLTVMGVAAQNAVKVPVVVHEYLVSSDEGEPSFPGDNLHVRCAEPGLSSRSRTKMRVLGR
jgi:hypothetical protein